MSNVIDRKVVEMDFDNANFERNAKTSLSTIDKLKAALDFKGSANSLSELSKSAQHFNMFNVENAAESVKNRFSAMEVIGVGALMRIGQQAVDTGEKLVKSMSTDQIMAGWDKFAKKTTSTATLLGQGFDMDTVTTQLKKLNWFTDETSYNFTDMVDSIGKFTASGKNLEESVDAMMGIANWAALSGQNATTASRAMYQLSQAMGAGVMRKEDYKSIQNAAMDTDEFRQKALDAAVALGTLKKNADGSYQSLVATGKGAEAFTKNQFTEKLTEGLWFTDKVMMQVFNDYSKGVDNIREFAEKHGLLASEVIGAKDALAQGEKALDDYVNELDINDDVKDGLKELVKGLDDFGIKAFGAAQKARTFEDAIDSVKDAASTTWMNIFEIFIGDAEKATEVWTDLANYLYDVFVDPLANFKSLLEEWVGSLDHGSDDIIQIFRNIASMAESITKPIKEAFAEIFPKKSGADFKRFITNLNNTIKSLVLSADQGRRLKNTFKGLFTVIKIGLKTIGSITKSVKPILIIIGQMIDKLLTVTGILGEITTATLNINKVGFKIENVIKIIGSRISWLLQSLSSAADFFKRSIDNGDKLLQAFLKTVTYITSELLKIVSETIVAIIKEITGIDLSVISNFIASIINYIKECLDGIIDTIFTGGGLEKALTYLFEALKKIGLKVIETFENVTGIDLTSFKAKFSQAIDNIKESLMEFVSAFDNIEPLTAKFERLADALDRVKAFFVPLAVVVREFFTGVLEKLKNYPWLSFQTFFNAKMMFELVSSITTLINTIPNIIKAFGDMKNSVCDTLKAVKDTFKAFQEEVKFKTLYAIAGAIVLLSVGLLILAAIDSDKIEGVLQALITCVVSLTGALFALSGIGRMMKGIGAAKMILPILAIASALYTMAEALKVISNSGYSYEEIAGNLKILSGIVALLGAIMVAIDLIPFNAKSIVKMIFVGSIMKTIATAAKSMAEAMVVLNQIDPDRTMSVIIAFVSGIAAVVSAVSALSTNGNTKGLFTSAASMILIAFAMKALAEAIMTLTEADPDKLAESFIVVGLALAAMVKVIQEITGKQVFLKTALSLVAIAYAMKLLTDSIEKLTSYDGGDLAKAFIILAGSMAVIAIVSNLLQSSLLKAGIGLIFVALALRSVMDTIKGLKDVNIDEIGWGLLALTGAFMLLCVATKLLNSNLAGAASMLIIAAGLYVMSEAIKKVAECDAGEVLADLVMITAAMAAMVLMATYATVILPGAAALVVLSVAFFIFAEGCKVLAAADPKTLIENLAISLGTLIVSLLALAGIAGLFNIFGAQLMAGAAMFMLASVLIGLGLAALGGGIAVIALATGTISASSGPLSDGLKMIGETLKQYNSDLLKGAGVLALLGASMIIAGIGSGLLAIGGAALAIVILGISLSLLALAGAIAVMNLVLYEFGLNTKAAGEGILQFSKDLLEAAPGLLAGAVEMKALIPELKKITKANNEFAGSAKGAGEGLGIMNAQFTNFNNSAIRFTDATSTLEETLKKLSVTLASMSVQISVALTASQKILNSAIPTFQTIGSNLVLGFVKGILAKTAIAVLTATALGRACANALKRSLQIHSPSRVTDEIAGYFMEGFTNRLDDTKSVEDSAENMGDAAIKSLNAAMSSAYDNLDSDISDPVIKPVMDLSEIQNGSKSLDAMVSRDRATSVMANYRTQRSYEEEEAANNANLLTNLNNKLLGAMTVNSENDTPFNINVVLEGNAGEIFRLVRVENDRFVKSAGYSPLLR